MRNGDESFGCLIDFSPVPHAVAMGRVLTAPVQFFDQPAVAVCCAPGGEDKRANFALDCAQPRSCLASVQSNATCCAASGTAVGTAEGPRAAERPGLGSPPLMVNVEAKPWRTRGTKLDDLVYQPEGGPSEAGDAVAIWRRFHEACRTQAPLFLGVWGVQDCVDDLFAQLERVNTDQGASVDCFLPEV